MQSRLTHARLKYLLGEVLLFDLRLPVRGYWTSFPQPGDFAVTPEDLLAETAGDKALIAVAWPVPGAQRRISFINHHIRYVPSVAPRYFVSLAGSFGDYLSANFQSKTRKNISRSVRQAQEAGGVFTAYRTPGEMELFLADAVELSRVTYQTRMLDAGLPDSAEFRMHALDLAQRNRVRGYLLHIQNRPAAFAYCESADDVTLYYSTIGYHPQYANLSPGTVLLYWLLKDLFDEHHFGWLDFGSGVSQYKSVFATGSQLCADVYLLRTNPKHLAIVLAHAGVDSLSATIGKALKAAGIKGLIRKTLRTIKGPK